MTHKDKKVFDPKKAANLDSPERLKRIPFEAIIAAARPFEGMCVADVGSGTGYYSFALLNSKVPPANIDAVDASPDMNSFFKKKLENHSLKSRVKIHIGSGERLPLPDHSVDLLMMGNVFHEFEDSKAALEEAKRVLRRSGRVLIIDWAIPLDTSNEPEAGPPYDHRIREEDVRQSLRLAGFENVELHTGFKDTYALSASKKE